MKKIIPNLICISIVSLLSWPVNSTTLSLEPSTANVVIGQNFTVDLKISGLGNHTAPSLAAFFAEIVFEENLINFESVTYGNLLGSPTDPFETDIVTTVDPNVVSLDEISFLSTSELDALQPADFTLATLLFKAVGAGSSNISFADIDFSDAEGNSFVPNLETTSVAVIPLPGTLLLFLLAFFSLIVAGKNKP